MSRFFFTLALVAAVAWLMPLHARADVYNGEEVVVNVGADSKPLDAHERVRMSVLTAAFWVPRADIFKAFGYAGLTLKPTRLISLFPSVGFATNRTSGNGTAFLVSLAVTFKPVDAKIVLYMQSNGYFAPAHAEYYGFYKLQFLPPQTAPLSFGAQCEQSNVSFWVGPNVAFDFGPVSLGVQWYVSVTYTVGHTIRFPPRFRSSV